MHEKEVYDFESGSGSYGWDTLAKKWNKVALTAGRKGVQKEVFRAAHAWRDKIAREEDESVR